jgi:hypothetical protein
VNISFFDDDKLWIVIAVTVLGCAGIWAVSDDVNAVTLIVSNAYSGLFGMAVGKALGDAKKLN